MQTQKERFLATVTLVFTVVLAAPITAGPQKPGGTAAPDDAPGALTQEEGAAQENAPETADETDSTLGSIWLKGKLETVILLNRHLNNFTIDSEITGSTATLKGEVESEVDKEIAEQLALSIDGIDTVVNQLTVAAKATDEKSNGSSSDPQKTAARREDATLAAGVKENFRSHGSTRELDVDVTVKDRKIILRGTVGSAAEKDLAGMLAADVEGVEDVDNQLVVTKLQQK